MSYVLSVDLGTTFTAAAAGRKTMRLELVTIPSACASTMPALTASDIPRSSALTIRFRSEAIQSASLSARSRASASQSCRCPSGGTHPGGAHPSHWTAR